MKRVYILLLIIAAFANLGTRIVPSQGAGGGVDALSDISVSICTSGKALYNDGASWVCQNWPSGGTYVFSIDADDGTTPEVIADGNTVLIAGGDGIYTDLSVTDTITISTLSTEAGFFTDNDAVSLTCSSGEGSAVVHNTEPLAYCDGGDSLQYAAYGDDSGDATGIEDALLVDADWGAAGADDLAGDKVDVGTATTRGTLELATPAEVITGTDTARAVTPEGVADYTFGGGAGDLGGTAAAPTVTAVQDDAINAITEIHDDLKTGAASELVTAVTGLTDECAQWDASGNLEGTGELCGSGGGSDLSVKKDNVEVDGEVDTLDFLDADFSLSEAPAHEIQIIVDASITRDAETAAAGDISGSIAAGFNIDDNTVVLDDMAACNEAEDRIIVYDSSGVPTCEVAIATALVVPDEFETLVYSGSAWVDDTIDLSENGFFNDTILGVANGGTGTATMGAFGVLIGSGVQAIQSMGVMSAGHLIIGDGVNYPSLGHIVGGDGATRTLAGGNIVVSVTLLDAADASGDTFSRSGLEFGDTGDDELTLLQGCSDSEALIWVSSTSTWDCGSPTADETNTLTLMTGVADDEIALGASGDTGAYVAINDCNASGEAITYDTGTNTFGCITGLSTGGTVDSIQGDGDTATTGAILSIDGGVGITTAVSGQILTVTFAPAEVDGAPVVWGNNTTSSWSWDVGGSSNPTIAFADDSIVITNAATFTVDTNAVLHDASTASALTSVGTLVDLDVDNININLNTISSTAGTDLNITPLAGQQIVLDGTIVIDAGVVTNVTSIAATTFTGNLVGASDTVAMADAGGDTTTFPLISTTSTPGDIELATDAGLTYNATSDTLSATIFSGAFTGSGANLNSIPSSALVDEIRSMVWNAGSWSVDGTNCDDPAELAAIGGAGGPEQYVVVCDLGAADGYLYGSTTLPDAFRASADVRFLASAILDTDTGGTPTLHGSIGMQCVGDNELIGTTWGTEADLDLIEADADSQWDIVTAASDADLDTSGCAGADTLWWRWTVCESTAGNCQASHADAITDFSLIALRMEYTTFIGD
jgi:hypothetical protein